MNDSLAKASRGGGWLFYLVGLVVVIGYGAWEFAVDDEVPTLIKLGTAAAILGILLLIVSVLRERLIERKSDKYEDVEI